MRRRPLLLLVVPLVVGLTSCEPPPPPPSDEPPVLVGAGDIADCSEKADTDTGRLVDEIDGEVFTAGDNVGKRGRPSDYTDCYEPVWGRRNDRVHPSPGNHDYETSGASGYFGYFGERAGPAGLGYYYFDVGDWRVFSLNSEANVSASARFVRDNAGDHECIAAIWHRPLRSSFGSDNAAAPLWQAVYDVGGDLVLNGHRHNYERFGLLDRGGQPVDGDERGMREIVVGTGGADFSQFRGVAAGSEVRDNSHHGVIEVELDEDGYAWTFHRTEDGTGDTGSGSC